MNNAVKDFFDRYAEDEALQARVKAEEAMYPGSLEIRDAVVQDVLLPIARELGYDFTVDDVRAYETRLRFANIGDDDAPRQTTVDDSYWLLERGWESNEAQFCDHGKE